MGLVGTALAERLSAAGHTVMGWDQEPERRYGGVNACDELYRSCSHIFLCLPHTGVCREVCRSPALRPGLTLLDASTGDPTAITALAAELSSAGIHYLEAMISGSSVLVARGEALVMVAGEASVYEACRGLLRVCAEQVVYVGKCGQAGKMKLVTNLVLGLNRAALAEGLLFAEDQGLDRRQTLDILRRSVAYSQVMDSKGEKMIEQDFAPQARLAQHLKDVRLMQAASKIPLPMTETHCRLLERAVQLGYAEHDNSAIIEAIRQP
jgi:3-hydroxyisobutyrate dehydrogenase-like beta-hydroxyacid dehydrogenase